MEGINLSSPRQNSRPFEISKCIFCQEDGNLVSTENGRENVRAASFHRDDKITRILNEIGDRTFYYHVSNRCYKNYTNKSNLEGTKRKRKEECETNDPTPAESRKSSRGEGRAPPSTDEAPSSIYYKQKCIICNNYSYKKVDKKFRISEESRGKAFLKASIFFQDSVFTRTFDLQDEHAVYGADLYYHKNCIQNYLHAYSNLSVEDRENHIPNPKQKAWEEVKGILDNGLNEGKGDELSVIRDYLNELLLEENEHFSNRDVKLFLLNQYGESIDFTYPDFQRKSTMVFSIAHNEIYQLAEAIRSINPFKVCASIIRKELASFDFDLNDKLCDAEDLRNSLGSIGMPKVILELFGEIYNFDPNTYEQVAKTVIDHEELDEEDIGEMEDEDCSSRKLSVHRCRKIQSLFQTMFYIFHSGRCRTPMHIMNAVWTHSLGNGGTSLTKILNHAGLSVSYSELLRYQYDLAKFASSQNNDERVQIPSHFQTNQFTSGAIDNWDHEGEKTSEHDTVAVLYQNDSGLRTTKPKLSEAGIIHGPRCFNEILSCQTLCDFYKPPRHPDYPKDIQIKENYPSYEGLLDIRIKDIAWSLARLNLSTDAVINKIKIPYPEEQTMPSWKSTNAVITEEKVSVKK